jgi:hypothetical protein
LDKLTAFHRAHDTGMVEVLRDLQGAIGQLPQRAYAAEAKPLGEELKKIQDGHRRGPQLLGDILPIVLARLGVGVVQSPESGEQHQRHPHEDGARHGYPPRHTAVNDASTRDRSQGGCRRYLRSLGYAETFLLER